MLNIVLIEPEIPNNTGNIGRLCVGTESKLHLIHPFGFEITDKNLKRSGLDYWVHLDWKEYQNVAEWKSQIPDLSRVFLMSSHADKNYLETKFKDGDWLVFGKESKGCGAYCLDIQWCIFDAASRTNVGANIFHRGRFSGGESRCLLVSE